MNRMMGNMDANEKEIGMETTILDDGYETRFRFIG
jgi:alpha-galactosidase